MKAGTQNWDITQHDNNWIYFANNEGLLEFDSKRWTLYPISNYTNVRSVHFDHSSGRIYAGAFNEFGYYERNKWGILQYHSLLDSIDSENKNFNEIWRIHQTNNCLFFQGGREIFCYQNEKIKRINLKNKIECSGVVHDLLLITTNEEGPLFLSGDLFFKLPHSEILKNKRVSAILPYKDKQILFVTDFHGVFIFDGEQTKTFTTSIDYFLQENQAFCAAIKNDNLAIGTVRNGLVVTNLMSNSNIFANIHSGLQNNTILSIQFDYQDNLWLGLDKGIDYLQLNTQIYDLFGNSQSYGTGYTSLVHDNLLYLGTNQGLYVTEYPLTNKPLPAEIELIPNMQGQVWALTQIDGTVFCGTDHGAFTIHGKQAHLISDIPGTWGFKKLKQHPEYVIGSSYRGFFLLKQMENKWQLKHFVKGFNDGGSMFAEEKDGSIWFSHWIKGISKLTFNEQLDAFTEELFDTEKGFYTNRNNVFFNINDQIIFSSDGGFFEYHKSSNSIKHATEIEELFGIFPHSIFLTQSAQGDIWAVTPRNIEFVSKDEQGNISIDSTSFSSIRNKLIPGFNHFNFIDSNVVLINTVDGFSYIDLSNRNFVHEKMDVVVCSVFLTGERDSLVGGYLNKQTEVPQFKHENNSVRFEFVSSEYREGVSVEYSYFLENYDTEWSVFSPTNVKEYTKLPKGNYTFKVRANNSAENKIVETSYKFTILPAWYESWIAYSIYMVICILFIFQLMIYIKKKSEKGALDMEIRKEEELKNQEKRYKAAAQEKEKEIIELKNQHLKYDLRRKAQELAGSTMNLIRKNEILLDVSKGLDKIVKDVKTTGESGSILKLITKMQSDIKQNIERDDNWKKFEANFDLVYENYLKRLSDKYSSLTNNDKKLCAYLKMGLSSKDIAPLMNMSYRSVEMSRYRLRKKMNLEREVNLTEFLQNF